MATKEDIKVLLVQSGVTLKEVAAEMTRCTGKNYSSSNLSQKLRRDTLKYNEAKLIAQILGYELTFKKVARPFEN